MDLKRFVLLAVVASLVLVATSFLKVPTPTGYVHLGDGIIYAAAIAFGPSFAAVSGAVGSTLADVLGGYFIWAPWTFIIKGVAGLIIGKMGQVNSRSAHALSKVIAWVRTVAGYAAGTAGLYSPA